MISKSINPYKNRGNQKNHHGLDLSGFSFRLSPQFPLLASSSPALAMPLRLGLPYLLFKRHPSFCTVLQQCILSVVLGKWRWGQGAAKKRKLKKCIEQVAIFIKAGDAFVFQPIFVWGTFLNLIFAEGRRTGSPQLLGKSEDPFGGILS